MKNKAKKITKTISINENIMKEIEKFKEKNYLTYSEAFERILTFGLENNKAVKNTMNQIMEKAEEILKEAGSDRTIERITISVKQTAEPISGR